MVTSAKNCVEKGNLFLYMTIPVSVQPIHRMMRLSTIMWNPLFLKDQKQQHFMTLVESFIFGLEKPAVK